MGLDFTSNIEKRLIGKWSVDYSLNRERDEFSFYEERSTLKMEWKTFINDASTSQVAELVFIDKEAEEYIFRLETEPKVKVKILFPNSYHSPSYMTLSMNQMSKRFYLKKIK